MQLDVYRSIISAGQLARTFSFSQVWMVHCNISRDLSFVCKVLSVTNEVGGFANAFFDLSVAGAVVETEVM